MTVPDIFFFTLGWTLAGFFLGVVMGRTLK